MNGAPKDLLKLPQSEVKTIRDHLMAPSGVKLNAPNKVGFYLFSGNYMVVENFNSGEMDVSLDFKRVSKVRKILTLPEGENPVFTLKGNKLDIRNISPRSLLVLRYR